MFLYLPFNGKFFLIRGLLLYIGLRSDFCLIFMFLQTNQTTFVIISNMFNKKGGSSLSGGTTFFN